MALHDAPCNLESRLPSAVADRRLRLRVVTGVVLGAGAIAATLALPSPWFAWLLWSIATLGIWEWGRLLNRSLLNQVTGLVVWFLLGALLTCHVQWFLSLFVLQWIFFMPWQFYRPFERDSSVQLSWFLSGLLALGLAWASLRALHAEFSPTHALFLIVLIALADTVAFFVGRRCGHYRLAPRLSPGKTWEGVLGALATAALLGVCGLFLLDIHQPERFVGLCVLTVALSILGDVYESLLKRRADAKDSSHLLPGHGGVLDRIDSLVAASPLFYLAFWSKWVT